MEKKQVFATSVIGLALLLGGCAHSLDKYYTSDGNLCAKISSFVIGTGETKKTVIVKDCAKMIYDTEGTGVSENATELGGNISEGLTRGAVEGMIPGG
jgi:hypothetical protein